MRVKLPRGRELFGWVDATLGGSRFKVTCSDGKERMCRMPGAKKRSVWVELGDLVVVEPWEVEPDKGDVVFRYTRTQIEWLRKKGILKG